jgi:hypothetical protein
MASDQITLSDGAVDWSAGVNSIRTTTIQSELNTNGMLRNELSWMNNGTVRGGGIIQRNGWFNQGSLPMVGQYQGSELYTPETGSPYFITVIQGNVWQTYPDDVANSVNLSLAFNIYLPVTNRCFFCQAEMFMIIQSGDGITVPLFWDGTTLRFSKGITDPLATTASPPHTNEIPAATAMCYYMGRLWYANNRNFSAGDIVGGPTAYPAPGPPFYGLRDSVLCVQENPLCVGGDGFTVPTNAGNIRGIAYAANQNTQLGEGALYIGTREQIYQLTVPVTRSDWINATATNQPLMTVALDANGWVNDRSIVSVNGDLFFQSLEPAIRSLTVAIRNFGSWGNVPISINEYRVIQFNDRNLLRYGSGIYFDNRLIQTALPYTCPVGTAHKCVIPLNFDVISSLWGQLSATQSSGGTTDYPAWEGMWEGLNVLELKSGDFNGVNRAFSFAWSDIKGAIELWEIQPAYLFDGNNDNRVLWYIEFPAFTFGKEFSLKKLSGGELWIDSMMGEVVFKIEYRPDGNPCWYPWHEWKDCTSGGNRRDVHDIYEINRQSYRQTVSLPSPPIACAQTMGRPSNMGYQFQCKLTIKGYCRVRGFILHAEPVMRKLYDNMTCP